MHYTFGMAKIDDIYNAVDDYGLITSSEAKELGMSRAEIVQQADRGKLIRVARGVYRMPVWPFLPQAPYATAVKAAGDGAFLYGESVVALLQLAPTDPSKIWIATPKRNRRNLGAGVIIKQLAGVTPVYLDGIACQPVFEALIAASQSMGLSRALNAVHEARVRGFITQKEAGLLEVELSK